MTNIFDTHAHYSSRQFDADRDAVMRALGEGGVVGVLECATHSGDAAAVLELAHKYPFVHAALGIHPESLGEEDAATVATYHGDWRAELAAMRPLFDDPAVIAVGEIGLDHHWPLPAQEQYDLFEAQLQLAQELDLPVSVHDREAHAEMYELLRQYRPRGVLHCYSGSAEDAAWLTAQGMALGFGGAVTYKGAKRAAKVLAMVPHELAVLETDCPYMSPEPVRGTRNDSRNIAHVAAINFSGGITLKARSPIHLEFIIDFPIEVSQEKADEGWEKLTALLEDYKKAHNGQSVYSPTFIEDLEPAVKELQAEYGFTYTVETAK